MSTEKRTDEEKEQIAMMQRVSGEFFRRMSGSADWIDFLNGFVLSVAQLYNEREQMNFSDGFDLVIAAMLHAEKFAKYQARKEN